MQAVLLRTDDLPAVLVVARCDIIALAKEGMQ